MCLRTALLALFATALLTTVPAAAQQFNASDGTNYDQNDSAFKMYWDSTNDFLQMLSAGAGTGAITWTTGLQMNTSGQSLFQVANDAGACDAAKLGRIRYNGTSTWEYCDDNNAWTAFGVDNLGDHTATQNIELNGHWLSGDGGNEGVAVDTAGNVGIDQAAPAATLHVGGEAIIGNTGLGCSGATEGGLRWNSTDKTVEVCNGTQWSLLVAVSSNSADPDPDAFSFTDLTDQAISSLIYSNTINVTGFDGPILAEVSGSGSPQLSINGGAWGSAGSINPGDSIRLRQISSSSPLTAVVAAVTIGSGSDNWSVTTRAGQLRVFSTVGTYSGNLGGLDGADAKCQTEASGLGYSGKWRAILADAYTDLSDRLVLAYPVVRASSTSTVVESSNLLASSLENTIYFSYTRAWTGTANGLGTKRSITCNSWTSASGAGGTGDRAATDATWLVANGGDSCSGLFYLFCIEQDATHFDHKTAVPFSTVIQSNATYVTGAGGTVSISGSGSPEFSINGGGWTTSGSASAGDTIRLRLTSSSSVSTTFTATVTIGSDNYDWDVTTRVWAKRIIYPSSYTGNIGGLSAADAICQSAGSGYGGTWKAIMSDSATNAKDRLSVSYPIYFADGTTLFESTDLWAGSREYGWGGGDEMWTGTLGDGTKAANTCSDWTSTAGTGHYGRPYWSSGGWIDGGDKACTESKPIWCLEQ